MPFYTYLFVNINPYIHVFLFASFGPNTLLIRIFTLFFTTIKIYHLLFVYTHFYLNIVLFTLAYINVFLFYDGSTRYIIKFFILFFVISFRFLENKVITKIIVMAIRIKYIVHAFACNHML